MVAGSKHAADKPCKTRPNNNKIGACEIINAIEPSILNIRPAFVILTRPILSDNPPATTINTPVKSDVRLTAILTILIST